MRSGMPRAAAAGAVALALATGLSACGLGGSSGPATSGAAGPTGVASRTPGATGSTSGQPSGTPAPEPSASPTPSTTPTPSSTATPSPTPTVKPRTTLVYGDQGPKVLELQQRLSALGYWLGRPDGSFGSLTQQAVFALQKAAGISRDGVVGPATKRALAQGVRPRATISSGTEIDLARQLLLVVRGGSVRYVLNTSTGNGEPYTTTYGASAIARTPTGTFTVLRKVDGMVENSLGRLWRPIFFTSTGIAVHGSSSVPPWPASHGCARVSNAAIDLIWANDLIPVGSTVRVR